MADATSAVIGVNQAIGSLAITAAIKTWLFQLSGRKSAMVQLIGDDSGAFQVSKDVAMAEYTTVPAGSGYNLLITGDVTIAIRRTTANQTVRATVIG